MRKNQINQDIYNLGRLIRKAKPEKMTITETVEIKMQWTGLSSLPDYKDT